MLSNIVFTKNRPLQLDAYLESLYRHFPPELIRTYIIYKVEMFEQEYEQLFQKYQQSVVIKENDFSSDFLRLLSQIDTKYLLFGVDDVVYFDSVDFDVIDATFREHPEDIFGFSLRLGEEYIEKGRDTISKIIAAGQNVYSINWTQGRTPTTRYPFELCATMYKTELVKKVIKSSRKNNFLLERLFAPASGVIRTLGHVVSTRPVLKSLGYFYSPNTLESWNCRWCQNNASELPGLLYFQKVCASAIQVNMVNVLTKNKTLDGDAEHTVESLNDKYKKGFKLDIDFVAEKKPAGPFCEQEYFRLIKNERI